MRDLNITEIARNRVMIQPLRLPPLTTEIPPCCLRNKPGVSRVLERADTQRVRMHNRDLRTRCEHPVQLVHERDKSVAWPADRVSVFHVMAGERLIDGAISEWPREHGEVVNNIHAVHVSYVNAREPLTLISSAPKV